MFKKSVTYPIIGLLLISSFVSHAQTCIPASAFTPTNQFTDRGDTVSDNKTGLMWKKCTEGQTWGMLVTTNTYGCIGDPAKYKWKSALELAQSTNSSGGFAGYVDWRVPNMSELISIVEYQCVGPALNLAVFPNSPRYKGDGYWPLYWSSSQLATGTSQVALGLDTNGGDFGQDSKNAYHHVRLVRDSK
ncbi:MAG: hypothetical protein BWK73_36495 [Thiothrix lacustris]|uniref:Lcl C-terminal domain-containing protein n=1 Tax=Thiothrix lacustris TaxID=525917 RepID=A0A1Y1QFU5_9GAMM|nr:MAG: hypothetical protein BWK73_36495 [Thiothrix lacustris]